MTPGKYKGFKSEENVIVGNVCCYGATSGKLFVRGVASERFCVRNSGATAVAEGVGDHGCEYMTGGRVVILGTTGKNFAAGMSGGIAYIYDPKQACDKMVNTGIVDLESVTDPREKAWLRSTITEYRECTSSEVARRILSNWSVSVLEFVKVLPRDYAKALKAQARAPKLIRAEPTDEEVARMARIPDIEDVVAETKKGTPLSKVRGFLKYPKKTDVNRPCKERLGDFEEISKRHDPTNLKIQSARCMDCGVAYCSSQHSGCPLSNVIPKFNDQVFKGQMKDALETLLTTNNFPEFTGRVCPAPCEGACTLGINSPSVSIKSIEAAIIDNAWEKGWMTPKQQTQRTSMIISIIGSGPAGLAAADQLNKAGHVVTVYERAPKVGGLLMYGIPNMKLDKRVVERRVNLMEAEGVQFVTSAEVGKSVDARLLLRNSHAVLLATGATWPRDLSIKGRELNGIHFAMSYLGVSENERGMNAKGKNVLVIGGGDTGNDCIGTAMRQGASNVVSFEIMPEPPQERAEGNPWPQWPKIFRVDYGHEEVMSVTGDDPRQYTTMSKEFLSDGNGNVTGVCTVQVAWAKDQNGRWAMNEVPGSEKTFKADLVFLAMGFLGPEATLLDQLELQKDRRGNVKTPPSKYHTNVPKVYTAGDCHRGQSLVVWAINEGRQAAREIDHDLMYDTSLPAEGGVVKRPTSPPRRHEVMKARM